MKAQKIKRTFTVALAFMLIGSINAAALEPEVNNEEEISMVSTAANEEIPSLESEAPPTPTEAETENKTKIADETPENETEESTEKATEEETKSNIPTVEYEELKLDGTTVNGTLEVLEVIENDGQHYQDKYYIIDVKESGTVTVELKNTTAAESFGTRSIGAAIYDEKLNYISSFEVANEINTTGNIGKKDFQLNPGKYYIGLAVGDAGAETPHSYSLTVTFSSDEPTNPTPSPTEATPTPTNPTSAGSAKTTTSSTTSTPTSSGKVATGDYSPILVILLVLAASSGAIVLIKKRISSR